jgi:lipid-A-disaccharide synthase
MKDKLRLFISTGEVSGDLQGALLVEALQRQAGNTNLEILALGGSRMAAAGATLLADTSAIGSVGILESVPYIWSTYQIQRRVKAYLQQHPPDLVVMVDYFGPNLAIGSFVRKHLPTVPTVYYIAPQEWVWSLSPRNTKRILEISDRLLAIFPAEATYYQKQGGTVSWVGHPLVDRMQSAPSRQQARQQLGIAEDEMAIALIPASRRQELKYIMPAMFGAAQQIQARLPQVKFWIPLSLEIYRVAIEQAIQDYGLNATLIPGQSQTVMAAADLALAKSGTANLEIALLDVPQVVMYRVSPLTAWIAQHLLKFDVPFVSPPNLVLMQMIVPELLQSQATPDRIAAESLDILLNASRRQTMLSQYAEMRQQLGDLGVCDRAAQEILQMLQ